ncbi:putative alpha-mannosidase I MNS5 [Platanthera guangdongensis]|uniref:Alpha-mannosidase I MNS5 n=1 Tax=Platanthera guangdongensis TaxID=2320717 RepID=A0ABR2MWN3_9ASPA
MLWNRRRRLEHLPPSSPSLAGGAGDTFPSEDDALLSNSMSQRVCPVISPAKTTHRVESACHIPDNCPGYRCRTNDECGIDSTTCRKRTCSLTGYCGLWVVVD